MKKIVPILGILAIICVCGFLLNESDNSDAATVTGSGTQADPYTYINMNAIESTNYFSTTKYVKIGSSVTITHIDDWPEYWSIESYDAGFGLSENSSGDLVGNVSGTSGSTFHFQISFWNDEAGDGSTFYRSFIIIDPTYTVTWKNWDGTVLETDYNVPAGTTPTYNGSTPTRASSAQYSYSFKGWSPAVGPISSNTTYTAQFNQTTRSYNITIAVSPAGYGSVNRTTITALYGSTISASGATVTVGTGSNNTSTATPTTATAQYTYSFSSWTGASGTVTGTKTITANFTRSTNTYTVAWNNWDGTRLETDTGVAYGTTPTYNGSTPTRASTAQYSYTFTGWSPTVSSVTGNATYTAQFSQSTRSYNITVVASPDGYGTVSRGTITALYGSTISASGATLTVGTGSNNTSTATPTTATAQYTYGFSNWTDASGTVTGAKTITANFTRTVNTYTITWKNWDNTVLETDTKVAYGSTPSYDGSTPTRTSTAQYSYTFTGWSPTVSSVTGNATYTAQFSSTVRTYTVTWKNWDNTTLETDTGVSYGTTPTYDGNTPTRATTAQYTYTFTGWSPTVGAITGNTTYTAQYSSTVNKYTVTWKNWDDTVLETDTDVPYGTVPTYDGSTPTKSATAQYSYTFSGWSPAVSGITGNTTYTAQFTSTVNEYTITWVNWDGTVLETDTDVPYGTMASYDGSTPVRSATAQYTYTFTDWDPTVDVVTGNATYTAQYSSVVNTYTVTWNNWDNTALETDTDVPYGTMPVYNGNTPVRPEDASHRYTFTGWSPSVDTVVGNITYTAQYSVTNLYTITWENYDGTVLETDLKVAEGTMPTYDGSTPVRPATAQYTYTFSEWSPAVSLVTGDATYTAQYTSVVNTYTITWNNWDGTTIRTDTGIPYGTTPVYDGTPVRPATAQYTYTFSGWSPTVVSVTGDATYTAQYTSTVNTYTITWQNYDGTVLETDMDIPYGTVPTYDGATPTRPFDTHGYAFKGWSPTVSEVTGNATYTAQYTSLYTITWKNWDGTVLETDTNVPEGTVPTYDGSTPTRPDDSIYRYTFNGWSPTPVAIVGNTEYIAQYSTTNIYTVVWRNWDGSILETDTGVEEGETPSYDGAIPTRPSDASYMYTFSGWNPVPSAITGYTEYTAQYTATPLYTATWQNWDGTVLEIDTGIPQGTVPTYDGSTPVRTATAQYTYTFAGWNPDVVAITGDVTYTAQFTSTVNTYTVTWKNWDDTVLRTDTGVAYGTTPVYGGTNPTRSSTAQYTYTFAGWNPAIATVTGNQIYTAQFTSTVNTYTVTWRNWDNTTLETDTGIPYGTIPVYDSATPTRASTAQYSYTFSGWNPVVSEVTGNATYTAQYTSNLRSYTISWVNWNGTVLETDANVMYGDVPSYDGTTPERDSTAQYSYTFSGWNPVISTVTGNATYTAQYTSAVRTYTVSWQNWNGIVLETDTDVPYGTVPTYNGAIPTRPDDGSYIYTFSGWSPVPSGIIGDTVYTAQYSTTPLYTVQWVNWDGTVLYEQVIPDGTMPSYVGDTPTRATSSTYVYTFSGWSPTPAPVSQDTVYTAQYTSVAWFTVVWRNWNGTVLETDTLVLNGSAPSYDGTTPVKDSDVSYDYTFSGWYPTPVTVTDNAEYTAQFTSSYRLYTDGDWTYHILITNTITLVEYIGTDSTVYVPEKIGNRGVNAMEDVLNGNQTVQNIVIPASITDISDTAFTGSAVREVLNLSGVEMTGTSYGLNNATVYTEIPGWFYVSDATYTVKVADRGMISELVRIIPMLMLLGLIVHVIRKQRNGE